MRWSVRTLIFLCGAMVSLSPVVAQSATSPASTGVSAEQIAVRLDAEARAKLRETLESTRLDLLSARGKADAELADSRDKLRSMTGGIGSTPQAVRAAIESLEAERLKLEVDQVGLAARRDALAETIARTSKQALMQTDQGNEQTLKHLEQQVALREREVDRMRKLQSTGNVSPSEVDAAVSHLEEAKIELSRERSKPPRITPELETVTALNRELLSASVSLAETVARLQFIEKKLQPAESSLPILDHMDRLERDRALLDEEIADVRRKELRNR